MDIRKLWDTVVFMIIRSQTDTDIVIHGTNKTNGCTSRKTTRWYRDKYNGSSNVVLGCMKFDMKVSTDYVYEGKDGNYTEDSPVKPFNNYGWSKLGGETPCMIYDNSLILRICMNNKPFPHQTT